MKIEENTLFVDTPVGDEEVLEFDASINQEQITQITVQTAELGASIIQKLLKIAKTKEVSIEDEFLKKFFQNITYK